MILIRSKEQYQNCNCENKPQDQAFSVERLANLANGQVSDLKPSSDFVGSGARVGSDKITGPDGTGNVTGFRQEAAVIAGGRESGVPSGSNGGERDKLSLLSRDLQGPLGINALNVSEGNLDSMQHVVENDSRFTHDDTGSPKQKVATEPKPAGNQSALQQTRATKLDRAQGESEQQNSTKNYGQVLAEAGLKFHTTKTLGGN